MGQSKEAIILTWERGQAGCIWETKPRVAPCQGAPPRQTRRSPNLTAPTVLQSPPYQAQVSPALSRWSLRRGATPGDGVGAGWGRGVTRSQRFPPGRKAGAGRPRRPRIKEAEAAFGFQPAHHARPAPVVAPLARQVGSPPGGGRDGGPGAPSTVGTALVAIPPRLYAEPIPRTPAPGGHHP